MLYPIPFEPLLKCMGHLYHARAGNQVYQRVWMKATVQGHLSDRCNINTNMKDTDLGAE